VLYGGELATLAELCLLVYCLLDVLRTPTQHVRNLPKPVWFLLCFVPPIVGPICWLLFGRPVYARGDATPEVSTRDYDPPRPPRAATPDDDEAFLRGLRERAEGQRRRAAEQARRRGEQEDEAPPS
jgi:hypothetical protein